MKSKSVRFTRLSFLSNYYCMIRDAFVVKKSPSGFKRLMLLLLITAFFTAPVPQALADSNTGSISGIVSSPGGDPLEGITVLLFTSEYVRVNNTTSDASGSYSFTGLGAGDYYVQFNPSSYNQNNGTTYAFKRYSGNDSNIYTAITIVDGQAISGIDVKLQYAGFIAGKVSDQNGLPINGISIQAQDEIGSYTTFYSDSNGEYIINQLPAGTYKVVFDPAAYNAPYGKDYLEYWYNNQVSYGAADEVTVTAGQTVAADAQLQVSTGTVSGVKAEACGNKINISWTAFAGAQGYNIYRAASLRAPYQNIGTTTSTSYTDANLSLSTTYRYKVKPVTATGEGSFSAPVGVKTRNTASTDALDNWDLFTPLTGTNSLQGVAYGNNTYVAAGYNGVIITSPDGRTWTRQQSGTSDYLRGAAYGSNTFVVLGTGNGIFTSPDGIKWTSGSSGVPQTLYEITYANNTFVAVGNNGTIITSDNGTTWIVQTSKTTETLNGISYGNNTFIAVGCNGTIVTSNDGKTWTRQESGSTDNLQGVAYGNNTFVAVGYNGAVYSSTDGVTWVDRSMDATTYYCVAFGNNTFAAVANGSTVITSPDGINWTTRTPGYSYPYYAVVNAQNSFLAVGNSGRIIQSGKLPVVNTPLAVVSTSPPNAVTTAVNIPIIVVFNKDIQAGSAFNSIRIVDSGSKAVNVLRSVNGSRLIISPASNLASETSYTVYVPGASIKDANGDTMSSDYSFSFTTSGSGVFLDGVKLAFSCEPYVKNGILMVPMRDIFTAFGMDVAWDNLNKQAAAIDEDTCITFTLGQGFGVVNGLGLPMELPSEMQKNRTFVPLGFACKAAGYTLDWNAESSTALITSPLPGEFRVLDIYVAPEYLREGDAFLVVALVSGKPSAVNLSIPGLGLSSSMENPAGRLWVCKDPTAGSAGHQSCQVQVVGGGSATQEFDILPLPEINSLEVYPQQGRVGDTFSFDAEVSGAYQVGINVGGLIEDYLIKTGDDTWHLDKVINTAGGGQDLEITVFADDVVKTFNIDLTVTE